MSGTTNFFTLWCWHTGALNSTTITHQTNTTCATRATTPLDVPGRSWTSLFHIVDMGFFSYRGCGYFSQIVGVGIFLEERIRAMQMTERGQSHSHDICRKIIHCTYFVTFIFVGQDICRNHTFHIFRYFCI